MICQKRNKRLLVFCLSFLLFCLVVTPCLFSVNTYASETETQSVTDYFREHNFYDTASYVCRKYASFPYLDYTTGANSGITYDAWADWLESKGKSDLLQEDVIINNASGGRGYDMPQDVRQELLNFVQEVYINDNPLSYTPCYLYSYNFLSPTAFSTYAQYVTTKQYLKNGTGRYSVLFMSGNNVLISQYIRQDMDLGFVGTTSQGSFTSVQPYVNWQTLGQMQLPPAVSINQAGTITEVTNNNWFGYSNLKNTATPNSSSKIIMSPNEKNELVYVFATLNAYKNYNAGNPQPYYMPSNSQTTVPYYDGFTDSDLNTAGNFYNNIVINTNGSTPTEIREKTDSVLGSLDGLLGGSDSESSSGGLFDSLGDIITGATGAISPIKEIVLGDIKELVADVFDFLPPTIITLWVSGIIFGIFFGVLKLIRG